MPSLTTSVTRITTAGFNYDLAGNLTADVTSSYAWNAESEIKTANSVNYTYDGDGNRVQKSNGKIYWYGAGTEILDESDASGNFTDEYVFFGGKRVAHRSVSSGNIFYYAEDMLGSSRAMVQAGQTSVCYDADFYPYGGEKVVTNTCPQNYKFEGKERDTETGNDDFGARYYSSVYGRWLSPDWSSVPAPVPYANLNNPQTLNLYAMVADNPETFADLDGHETAGRGCDANTSVDCAGKIQTNQQLQKPTAQQLAQQVSPETKKAIAASVKASDLPTKDDKKGGFHEESGVAGKNASGELVVSPDKPGPYANPDVTKEAHPSYQPVDQNQRNSMTDVKVNWHVHPSGTTATNSWKQAASPEDRKAAVPGAINIVVGARDKTVYFYSGSGDVGQMSLKEFMKEP